MTIPGHRKPGIPSVKMKVEIDMDIVQEVDKVREAIPRTRMVARLLRLALENMKKEKDRVVA